MKKTKDEILLVFRNTQDLKELSRRPPKGWKQAPRVWEEEEWNEQRKMMKIKPIYTNLGAPKSCQVLIQVLRYGLVSLQVSNVG